MSTIAILPVEMPSDGRPDLSLQNFGGEPLLYRFIQIANESRSISGVFVCSADHRVLDRAREAGAGSHLIPRVLYQETAFPDPVALHFLREYQLLQHQLPDILAVLPLKNPLLSGFDLDHAIAEVSRFGCDSAFSARAVQHNLWRTSEQKQATRRGADQLPQATSKYFEEDGSFYVFRTVGFQEAKSRYFGQTLPCIVPDERRSDIRNKRDLDELRQSQAETQRVRDRVLGSLTIKGVVIGFESVVQGKELSFSAEGIPSVRFHQDDFSAIEILRQSGVHVAIMAKGDNPFVKHWATGARIEQILDGKTPLQSLRTWCTEKDISVKESVFFCGSEDERGCAQEAGLGVCVSDVTDRVREACQLNLRTKGGPQAISEFVFDVYVSDES